MEWDSVDPVQVGKLEKEVQLAEAAANIAEEALQQARAKLADVNRKYFWSAFLLAVQQSHTVNSFMAKWNAAKEHFRGTLAPPPDYTEEEDGGIPFCDTDDYADFTNVDEAIDEALDYIRTGIGEKGAKEFAHAKTGEGFHLLFALSKWYDAFAAEFHDVITNLHKESQDEIIEMWEDLFEMCQPIDSEDETDAKRFVVVHKLGEPYSGAFPAPQEH